MHKFSTSRLLSFVTGIVTCLPIAAQTAHTITSAPVGVTITVDAGTCTTPCTYSWTAGTTHTVVAAGPQAGAAGVQYVYASWSDGGTATRRVHIERPATRHANFVLKYLSCIFKFYPISIDSNDIRLILAELPNIPVHVK